MTPPGDKILGVGDHTSLRGVGRRWPRSSTQNGSTNIYCITTFLRKLTESIRVTAKLAHQVAGFVLNDPQGGH